MGDDYELCCAYRLTVSSTSSRAHRPLPHLPGQMSTNYRGRYESGIRTMQAFLERNPRLVKPSVVRTRGPTPIRVG